MQNGTVISNGNGAPYVSVVAGGAGFLGSHLCEALIASGHQVICVDSFVSSSRRNIRSLESSPDFRLFEADVCEPLGLRGRVDRVYNLACAASPPRYQADPIHTMTTSVVGSLNLLRLAEARGARYLQASTSEVYGDPEQHPQSESYSGHVNCTGPRACYDEGKRAAEALCFDFLRLGRVDVRVARIFNTYGPRMQPDDGRIVSNFIVQALSGKPMTIYGTGEQTRSFCYVSDLVRGLMALMEARLPHEGPVNLGNPDEHRVLEFARIVADLVGARNAVRHEALPTDDPRRRCPDISLARELLGWEPTVSLRDGLRETIEWFRSTEVASHPHDPAPEQRMAATAGK
ncbi:SDR family oxidoreductase [Rhodobacteraceae bacterium MCCB 386]|nr:SDR family oxidoreductase [Roseitranquillus sediminis]